MAWTVDEFPNVPFRTLVCEADSQDELFAVQAKAEKKGWTLLAEGTVGGTDRLAMWFIKPSDSPARAA